MQFHDQSEICVGLVRLGCSNMVERISRGDGLRKATFILVLAIIIVVFAGLLSTGLLSKSSVTGRSGKELVGQQAPGFTAPLIGGGSSELDDYLGDPLIVNFWSSWCPPCRKEMPGLENIWKEHKEDGITILGVNVQDEEEDAELYLAEVGVTFPNVIDLGGRITVDYGVTGLPVSFFIAGDGKVIGRWVGALSNERLGLWTRRLVEGESDPNGLTGENLEAYRDFN